MKISKAIEILTQVVKKEDLISQQDAYDAIQLGIKALEQVKLSRDPNGVPPYTLLQGEDPE